MVGRSLEIPHLRMSGRLCICIFHHCGGSDHIIKSRGQIYEINPLMFKSRGVEVSLATFPEGIDIWGIPQDIVVYQQS